MRGRDIEILYRKLSGELARRARHKHGLSKEDASDVVQDAFVLALVKIQAEGNARGWFMHVVDRLAVNLLRTAMRRRELLVRWAPRGKHAEGDAEEI